jgi:hypothetical protein
MLCQICLQAEATIHVSICSSSETPVESDYCHACYQIKDADRAPADPPVFPLSRFTIRDLMIVAGLFAILNAAIVLYMRSGQISGPPVRIGDRMPKVLVIVNLVFAVYLSEFVVMRWFKEYIWHKKAGGTIRTAPWGPDRRATEPTDVWSEASPREQIFLSLLHAWFSLCFVVVLFPTLGTDSWVLRLNFGPFLTLLLTVIGVWILLIWGLVDSTRRR